MKSRLGIGVVVHPKQLVEVGRRTERQAGLALLVAYSWCTSCDFMDVQWNLYGCYIYM
jgi:hypothetical protein